MKIFIAVPCMDQVAAQFAQNLAVLRKEGEVEVAFLIGSLIYESRNSLAKKALSSGADYIMWFDSDMTFPADTLSRMLKHMEDGKEIVSGIYFRRCAPFNPVLFEEQKDYEHIEKWVDYNEYPKDSVFPIGACGFGCVMVKSTVFYDMALNNEPWFTPYGGMGEDIAFCIRANKLGHKIYCDSTIKCGHVGHLLVTEEVYQASK